MTLEQPVIAILCGNPLSANMETVLLNLGRMLGDVFRLHLLAGGSAFPDRLEPYFSVHSFPVSGFDPAGLKYAHRACARYLETSRPDVMINIGQPHTLGFALTRLAKRYGISVVVRMTGDTFREARLVNNPLGRLKKWILHEQLGALAYKNATIIAPVGQSLKKSLVERGYPEAKIVVIPQPFDPSRFTPAVPHEKPELKQKLGLDPERNTVLFVGRISRLKGVDRLLKIVTRVRQQSDRFQFCLVGSGELERQITAAFPAGVVTLAGAVPNEKIVDYYRASDLFVFPSRTEGLPNTILEAIATGLPVIASPVGEIPAYVSRTSDRIEDYADHILAGNWTPEALPDWFDWEKQKEAYRDLFRQAMEAL